MFGPGFTITPLGYRRIAWAALAVLTLIVFTGSAVRLTGSGLGCPDWPRCYEDGPIHAQTGTHDWIEFTNRLLTGVVAFPCIAAFLGAFRRRPYRRDLVLPALVLPLGVLAQAVLGGMTVIWELAPEFVMAHYSVSMVLLIGAVVLVWRARREPTDPPVVGERRAVWFTRALVALGGLVVVAGTAATAAGPHTGGEGTGDIVPRVQWFGADTVDWTIKSHARIAALLGLLCVGLWFSLRRRGASPGHIRAVMWVALLVAAQGVVGTTQYVLEVPAELVWIHVVLACFTWLALLWAWVEAGRPVDRADDAPRGPAEPSPEREQPRVPVAAG